jgi:hypothetical protein
VNYPPKFFDCVDWGRNHMVADDGGEADTDWLAAIEKAAVRELLFELDVPTDFGVESPSRKNLWDAAIRDIRGYRRALLRIANGYCYCGRINGHHDCFIDEARKALGREVEGPGLVLS